MSTYKAYDEGRKRELLETLLEQLREDDTDQELAHDHLFVTINYVGSFSALPPGDQAILLQKAEIIESERRLEDPTKRLQVHSDRHSYENAMRAWHGENRRQAAERDLLRLQRSRGDRGPAVHISRSDKRVRNKRNYSSEEERPRQRQARHHRKRRKDCSSSSSSSEEYVRYQPLKRTTKRSGGRGRL